ncbi:MAG: hypothetical protein HYV67_00935 [Candidatus Taylorbacteria bacterium]|nr:hypothetical protein [Candidatus Taylorbacteria bacterium]
MKLTTHNSQLTTNRGQAVITAVVFFLVIAATVSIGVINPVLRQLKQADDFLRTRASLFASQSVNEDALYRLKTNKKFTSPSTLSLGGYRATATSTTVAGGLQINSSGNGFNLTRNIRTHLISGSGASFNYGVQVGAGGVILENTSSVAGNLYSNGPVTGAGSNLIKGDAVSAGPNGQIDGVHATSSAYAHIIRNSTIDKDAYYQTISGSTVAGTLYPGSADQATSTLPIAAAQVTQWQNDAAAGGTIASPCPYKISDTATIGPAKINCDLEISGNNYTVTLGGALWVAGNITVKNSPTIKVSPSLGHKSIPIVADNPADHTDSSIITLSNSVQFQGSGTPGSFVVLISQNNRAANGGNGSGEEAIIAQNNVSGAVLLYAALGEIRLQNSISLKEVTAYRLRLQNSAEVVYDTGLANLLFTSGPSGSYVFDGWREVQ